MSDPLAAVWIGPLAVGVTAQTDPITFGPISQWERDWMRAANSPLWTGQWPDQVWDNSAWFVLRPAGHGHIQLSTSYIFLSDPEVPGGFNYVVLSVFSRWANAGASLPLPGTNPAAPLDYWPTWQSVAPEVFPDTHLYVHVVSTRPVLSDCRLLVTPLDITIDAPPVVAPALLRVRFP